MKIYTTTEYYNNDMHTSHEILAPSDLWGQI